MALGAGECCKMTKSLAEFLARGGHRVSNLADVGVGELSQEPVACRPTRNLGDLLLPGSVESELGERESSLGEMGGALWVVKRSALTWRWSLCRLPGILSWLLHSGPLGSYRWMGVDHTYVKMVRAQVCRWMGFYQVNTPV